MKKNIVLFFLLILILIMVSPLMAKEYIVNSPDKNIQISLKITDQIYYAAFYKNVPLIDPSPISLTIDGKSVPSLNPVVQDTKHRLINRIIKPVINEKRSKVVDYCNELTIEFADSCGIIFRAYNDGIAWRFFTQFKRDVIIDNEGVEFNFANSDTLYVPMISCRKDNGSTVDCFHTAHETPYKKILLGDGLSGKVGLLPALVYPEDNRPRMLIAEADVEDYPGMYLRSNPNRKNSLKSVFPNYPVEFSVLTVAQEFDWKAVRTREGYIAKAKGTRKFPWRIIVIAEEDKKLAETDIVLRLSGESQIGNASWIKPGKSTSEWLYANHIYGVDFKAGYNTETYKYYIDFAHQFGLKYVLFDAGWSNPQDIFDLTPEMDMEELTRYAKEKNIGLVLWTSSIAMETQMEEALNQFKEWGIKGIMVDFFNRDDQLAVSFFQKIAKEAAEKQIFVDFHGISKPEGIRGKYPNVLTREGLLAYENYKWSALPSPEYEVTIPFIRMVAGPMDYEPGAMRNATKADFRPVGGQPMSMGTRIHQMAMFIVYESPYAKMGGNPSDYLKEPEYTHFIVDIPTVWEETKVLDGKVSDYIVTLRRAGNGDYYIGAMTDWSPREIEINYDFLDKGEYNIIIYQDGINADTYASDYKKVSTTITNRDRQLIRMAPGGGWVARIIKIE